VKEYLIDTAPIPKWRQHVNLFNRLGRKGELILAFAHLAREMWMSPDPSVRPKEFKEVVGKFKEEFKGSEQQDTQEFLTFLIDGLHEEVNLALEKPYFSYPESDHREIKDLANECWSLNLLRNWSLFSFLFTGLLGSELTCTNCKNTSWSFEPFMSLSLPITMTTLVPINIILIPIQKAKSKLLQIALLMSKTDKIEQMIKKMYEMPSTALWPESEKTEIVICRILNTKIVQVFSPNTKIEIIEPYCASKEIFAYEILTETGRNKDYLKPFNQGHDEAEIPDEIEEGKIMSPSSPMPDKYTSYNRLYSNPSQQLISPQKEASKPAKSLQAKPLEFFAHVLNRTISFNPKYVWKRYEAVVCGNPTILPLNMDLTCYELYERAWEAATQFIRPNSKYLSGSDNLWWRHSNPEKQKNKRPFILRNVAASGEICSKCQWNQQCLGCIIMPDKNTRISLTQGDYISIDWYLDVYQDEYQLVYQDLEKHDSVEETRKIIQKPISLEEVMSKFTSNEELNSDCSICKKVSPRTKRLSILKLPMILIIHLKRYKEKYILFTLFKLIAFIQKIIF